MKVKLKRCECRPSRFCFPYVFSAWLTGFVSADESLYIERIRPVLKERCCACHGALKQEAGLRLDTGALLRKGGDSGAVVDTTAVEDSTLLERLISDDPDFRMPPDGKPLTDDEVKHFREWIAGGAVSPKDETPEPDPSEHWAFRRPVRPPIPDVEDDLWSRNVIDQLVRSQHTARRLKPAPDASAERLLRRVTLDLIGIPPTIEQLEAFVRDPSPERYAEVVDQLLASPHYGERWGRHWMDVWRYSDWYGRRQQNDVRNSAPQIWRWRDWIVNSLNEDKSYARMIQEMLAADEIAADDDSTWAATGYLVRNYYSLNPNEWMRHNVEYTGKAFLGLTFNCAHCHDHKYDPIAHDDYFRMRAFFEPIGIRQDRVVGEPEPPPFEPYKYGGSRKVVRTGMVRIFDEKPDAETWFYTGGDERNRVNERGSIAPGVPEFLNVPFEDAIAPIPLPVTGWYPGARPELQKALIDEHTSGVAAAEAALRDVRREDTDTTKQTHRLKAAQQAFDAAIQNAVAAGEQGALSGRQSLVIDASSGRRILQHSLPALKSLTDGTVFRFKLSILRDGHFNFQLARDASKSLTALYFAFAGGEIRAYRPGSFSEFVAGAYSAAEPPHLLEVSLSIHPAADVAKLSVEAISGDERTSLVSQVDIALNGWDPTKNAHQPFTLDCRPGTHVLIDDISVRAGEQAWLWDFEAPGFPDGKDVAGVQGWTVHHLAAGSATSVVSAVAGCRSAAAEYEQLLLAKEALLSASSRIRIAEQRLDAARRELASLKSTIAADNALRDNADQDSIAALARQAYAAQLAAGTASARWRVSDAQRQLSDARELPDSDKQKKTLIQESEKKLSTARSDLASANQQVATKPESADYQRLSPVTSSQSTGRRSALAAWMTHPKNPLTPRVAINHIWLRHFHTPLVESVYDFGRNGKTPTHPKVLDWLAVELVENGWSMKHIHRLIVSSRTYQMSSSARGLEGNQATDGENRYLWRMNSGRMEAEVVRDSILFTAALLDSSIGGEVRPNTEAMTTFRRSLYYEVYPENGGNNVMAEVFDAPDPGECFRRTATVMPQQALALSNSKLIHSSAKAVVKAISRVSGKDDEHFVRQAFLRILSRQPNESEHRAAMGFLGGQQQPAQAAREGLVRVLFNHNDFVTIR